MPGRSGILTDFLKHDAVYWAAPSSDGLGGRTFADPVEIKCRWNEEAVIFINPAGQQEVSKASVYVGVDVVLGGYLFRGTLADLTSGEEADPQVVAEAYEVRGRSKKSDLSGERFLRKVWV